MYDLEHVEHLRELNSSLQKENEQLRELNIELLSVLLEYGEYFGAAYEADCSADDTCCCDLGALNNKVNKVIIKARKFNE